MQKQITHDDIVPLVQNHGNNEVLDVPVRIHHDRMRVSPSLHGELHWSKEATASSKSPSPPTQMPPHYRPGNGKKTHMVGWHKKFGKARQLPVLIHVHSTERNDGDDPTGFHDMCLRSSQWHVWWTTCSSSWSDFHRSTSHLVSGCKHFRKDAGSHLFWNAPPLKHFNGFSPRLHLTLPMHQWSSSCHPTGWSCPPSRKWHLRPRCGAIS